MLLPHVPFLTAAMQPPDPEIELLRRARDGDREAFGEIFSRYRRRVFRVARRMCGSDDEAWDITQEAFMRAMQAMDRFDVDYRFFTWMYRIVTNVAINHSRKRGRRREVRFDEEYGADGEQALPDRTEERAMRRQLVEAVESAVEKLSPPLRAVFVLRVDQQLSYREIAESLDIAMGTVMSRLSRARQQIREEVGPLAGDA